MRVALSIALVGWLVRGQAQAHERPLVYTVEPAWAASCVKRATVAVRALAVSDPRLANAVVTERLGASTMSDGWGPQACRIDRQYDTVELRAAVEGGVVLSLVVRAGPALAAGLSGSGFDDRNGRTMYSAMPSYEWSDGSPGRGAHVSITEVFMNAATQRFMSTMESVATACMAEAPLLAPGPRTRPSDAAIVAACRTIPGNADAATVRECIESEQLVQDLEGMCLDGKIENAAYIDAELPLLRLLTTAREPLPYLLRLARSSNPAARMMAVDGLYVTWSETSARELLRLTLDPGFVMFNDEHFTRPEGVGNRALAKLRDAAARDLFNDALLGD